MEDQYKLNPKVLRTIEKMHGAIMIHRFEESTPTNNVNWIIQIILKLDAQVSTPLHNMKIRLTSTSVFQQFQLADD